jgi:hypothetical protein
MILYAYASSLPSMLERSTKWMEPHISSSRLLRRWAVVSTGWVTDLSRTLTRWQRGRMAKSEVPKLGA